MKVAKIASKEGPQAPLIVAYLSVAEAEMLLAGNTETTNIFRRYVRQAVDGPVKERKAKT